MIENFRLNTKLIIDLYLLIQKFKQVKRSDGDNKVLDIYFIDSESNSISDIIILQESIPIYVSITSYFVLIHQR